MKKSIKFEVKEEIWVVANRYGAWHVCNSEKGAKLFIKNLSLRNTRIFKYTLSK
jgi:hypothetical protein